MDHVQQALEEQIKIHGEAIQKLREEATGLHNEIVLLSQVIAGLVIDNGDTISGETWDRVHNRGFIPHSTRMVTGLEKDRGEIKIQVNLPKSS